jgi:hypothetical protein
MPRAAYQITIDDYRLALGYLRRQVSIGGDLKAQLLRMDSRASHDRAAELQAWCDTNLSREEWQRLRLSVRKSRQRWNRPDSVT